ncbi:HLA class II histocompatibility antigen, DR beta 4 chain [Trifolium repens]|nr:HLA class II histocompatibility antigen, DR beta 4 chain [Trifolium repens]
MYKNKLQELCHKKSWNLPEYVTTRKGPPHDSRFSTTVTVNSIPFTNPTEWRTVKLSQNEAAMLAFNHFSQQQQNPISSPFLPNLSTFPQPTFSATASSSSHCLPVHSPDVNNTLPTYSAVQPNSEPACETSQINSPVADVADVTKAQDLKRHCNMTLVSATDTKALQSRCKGPASPSIVLHVCPTLEGTSCQANLGKRLRTSLKAVDSERTAKHVFNLERSPKKRALTPTGSHATSSSDLKEVVPNFSWLQNVCQALSVADDLLNAERVKFKEEIERLKKEEERASVLSTQLTTAKDSLQELSKKYDKLEQIHKETLEELRHLKESKEKSDKAFDELASELASLSNRAKNRGESRIGEL